MELVSEGCSEIILKLGNMEEQYTFTRPSSWVRNIVAGSKYLDHVGEMKVTNHTTGEYAVVTFKEATGGGFFGTVSDRNNVVAQLYNGNGTFEKRVSGKWSDTLSEELGPDQYAVIWRSGTPNIPNYPDYYGFTQYCMELNEITDLEKDKIPKTDTRYRPDQRFFENGKVEGGAKMHN
jgi:hypothetical protein